MLVEVTQPVALKFYIILRLADKPSLSQCPFTLTVIMLIKNTFLNTRTIIQKLH